MDVDNAILRQLGVAFREWILARDIAIRRVPDELQVGMRGRLQKTRGLGGRGDVAGMLVLEPESSIPSLPAWSASRSSAPTTTSKYLSGSVVRQ